MRLLRRLLSILLLAAFGLPIASPLFALEARDEASLPACCRRDGKHHCMMGMMARGLQDAGSHGFRAPLERCPYCPATVTAAQGNHWAVPLTETPFASALFHPLGLRQTEVRRRIARDLSRQKRGPPAATRA